MSTIQEQLDQALNNVPLVHEAGIEAGRQAEYDAFWDAYQNNGTRTNYFGAFSGNGWRTSTGTFKPKYDIVPVVARNMFYSLDWAQLDKFNLAECGVKIDFSKCTNLYSTFSASGIDVNIPIDCSSCTDLNSTFAYSGPFAIRKLIVHENLTYSSAFASNNNLLVLNIEGTIGKTINLGACSKLNLESAISVISHLKNLTGTGTTATITFHSNVWALLDADTTYPEGSTSWKTYITDVLGWSRA